MSAIAKLYDQDFHAWAQQNALLIRAGRLNELDIEHLAEEIESMGARERRELVNRLELLMVHLLKWQYQPGFRGRSWQLTIKEQRRKLARLLRDNPSLKARLQDVLPDAYGDAILSAANETGLDEAAFPAQCPYSESQILDDTYYPETASERT